MLYAFKLGRKLRGEEPYCPEKGGKGGSDKSAKYAAEAQKYAADLQNQQFNTIMNNLKPFTPLADKYVGSLENLSSLEGQGQALNQYYNSQQYKDLAGQARYQSLAAAEATGGLGSTATGNQLAIITLMHGLLVIHRDYLSLPRKIQRLLHRHNRRFPVLMSSNATISPANWHSGKSCWSASKAR